MSMSSPQRRDLTTFEVDHELRHVPEADDCLYEDTSLEAVLRAVWRAGYDAGMLTGQCLSDRDTQ